MSFIRSFVHKVKTYVHSFHTIHTLFLACRRIKSEINQLIHPVFFFFLLLRKVKQFHTWLEWTAAIFFYTILCRRTDGQTDRPRNRSTDDVYRRASLLQLTDWGSTPPPPTWSKQQQSAHTHSSNAHHKCSERERERVFGAKMRSRPPEIHRAYFFLKEPT